MAETKKKVLVSLDQDKYQNLEIECLVVSDIKKFVEKLLVEMEKTGKEPGIAQKTATITARKGELGEEVDTRPRVERDGKIYLLNETKSKVSVEGSMIVKNPDGEEYIVKPDAFDKKYKTTDTPGMYEPIASPIKYIKLPCDISFTAPWGSEEFGLKGGILNVSDLDNIYSITNEAFNKTYEVQKTPQQNKNKQEQSQSQPGE